MFNVPDDILLKLAFQRGVLALLSSDPHDPIIEKAIEKLDGLLDQVI